MGILKARQSLPGSTAAIQVQESSSPRPIAAAEFRHLRMWLLVVLGVAAIAQLQRPEDIFDVSW